MNEDMYIVVVDTRGMSTSQIDGYEEHTCTEEYFDKHVLSNPKVVCTKSKVAELCGLDMKVYFHDYTHQQHIHRLHDPPTVGITEEEKEFSPPNVINRGATLLTFDPRTGFCEYRILGKAYVMVDSGDYPLSNHQVWGIQDLISEARDVYHCDPEHAERGHQQLLRWCQDYRNQNYGPLTIYEPRSVPWKEYVDNLSTKTVYVPEDHYHHRHHGGYHRQKVDHSHGKYGRVRISEGDELIFSDGEQKHRAKASRAPNMFTACHLLD